MKTLWDGQEKIRDELKGLPDVYARRDDMTASIEALFRKLDRIEDKIDKKADKGSG